MHSKEVPAASYSRARALLLALDRHAEHLREKIIGSEFDDTIPGSQVMWSLYCMTLLGDYCRAAAFLNSGKHARVLSTISRSAYEYYISIRYVISHPEVAQEQFLTLGGRQFRRLRDMDPSNPELAELFSAWKMDAESLKATPYTGNFNFQKAAFEVEDETLQHCPKYGLNYVMMSVFAHPDAAGYLDVFDLDFEEGLTICFRNGGFHAFDMLILIAQHMIAAFDAVKSQLKVVHFENEALRQRIAALVAEHFDIVPSRS